MRAPADPDRPAPAAEPGEAALPLSWRSWHRRWDYLLALGISLALAALFKHDWDGYVFETAVRQFWAGHSPYDVAASHPWYSYLGPSDTITQWYAYPPLPLLGMSVTFAPALVLHLAAPLERVLLKLPILLASLALAPVAAAWCRRLGSSPAEALRVERRFLFNPYFLLVGAAWGMTDVALMALYMGGLLAYGNGRPGKAGALVALATLVKPFPALLLLPLIPYLIDRHGLPAFRRFALVGTLTALPLVVPFLAASPAGFWQQSVGMHLARLPQGVTAWRLWPLNLIPPAAVTVTSLVMMCFSLVGVGWLSTRLRGRGTTLMLTLLAAIAVLVWNRVLNEQYLALVVAPLLILDQVHVLPRLGHWLTRWTPAFFAALIAVGGFHFLTFIPPDEALPWFGKPVDAVAQDLRDSAPVFWEYLQGTMESLVVVTLLALAALAIVLVARRARQTRNERHFAPVAAAGAIFLLLAVAPAFGGAVAQEGSAFKPRTAEPRLAAFTYVWWQNPAHDPGVRYGNWEVVSQVPELGYYTSTRGVARLQVAAMREAGIDTAIVSYHRGELARYQTFAEEAAAAGLRVVPLIELNQLYDQPVHHPRDETGALQPFAAYRLDNGTRDAIVDFTLDLQGPIAAANNLRLAGKPAVFYYDSYTSTVGYSDEDRADLARSLLSLYSLPTLRAAFNDSAMPGTVAGVLAHYPSAYKEFFHEGSAALWRAAHLEAHRMFWREVRAELEARLGPVALVSGEAFNERAGFEAGTEKGIVDLDLFDGAFIYSPSFTWGNAPRDNFTQRFPATFAQWEDRNRWLTAFAAGTGTASSYGIAPSYDDTVNRATGFTIPADTPYGPFYDLSWNSTLRAPPTLPAVATWNEHFEGSSIEPTREFGDRFLAPTKAASDRLAQAAPSAPRLLALVHEVASRTSPGHSEMDEPHEQGLALIASLYRAGNASIAAVDAQSQRVAAARPDLILVDGGRDSYPLGPQVAQRLAAWDAPIVLFGPEVAVPLRALAGCAAPAAPEGPRTLVPGDRLAATAEGLVLTRDGATTLVGIQCGADARTSVKPWTLDGVAGAGCLQVALVALAGMPGPDSCVVGALDASVVFTRSA